MKTNTQLYFAFTGLMILSIDAIAADYECASTTPSDIPLLMVGLLAGSVLPLLVRVLAFILDKLIALIHPIIIELCMLGNLRVRIFHVNVVFINPLLARQIRLRLKSL